MPHNEQKDLKDLQFLWIVWLLKGIYMSFLINCDDILTWQKCTKTMFVLPACGYFPFLGGGKQFFLPIKYLFNNGYVMPTQNSNAMSSEYPI